MKTLAFVLAFSTATSAAAVDLRDALRAAREADPTMASALASRDAAQEYVAIARAKLRPQVTLQSTYQSLDQSTDRTGTVQDFSGPSRNTQLTLRQSIYRRRDRVGLDIGKIQAEYGDYQASSAQADLWNRTATAWVDVLLGQALVELTGSTVETVRHAAEQERRRFAAGDGTRDAVAEAAAQLALARAQLTEANLDLQAKLNAFNLLTRMGAASFDGYGLPPATEIKAFQESREQLLARVLDANPDLAMARLNASIGERRLEQSSADHWPTLDLIGSMSRAQNDTSNTLGARYSNSQVGLQLMIPIYSGGGISASQRQAASAYAAAKADTAALVQKLETQFFTEWSALEGQRERAQALLEVVRAAREQKRAAELGIKAGLRTWADLSSAELLLMRRESDLANIAGAMLKSQARLLSFLPATDPAWENWTAGVSIQARR